MKFQDKDDYIPEEHKVWKQYSLLKKRPLIPNEIRTYQGHLHHTILTELRHVVFQFLVKAPRPITFQEPTFLVLWYSQEAKSKGKDQA